MAVISLDIRDVAHSVVSQYKPTFARCRFNRVDSFPYLRIEVSHHYARDYGIVVWFP